MSKRILVLMVLVVASLLLVTASVQATEPATGDVVVRIFMDANNDGSDKGEFGLKGWTVGLSNGMTAVTGPDGFATFHDVEIANYTVRIVANNRGGKAWENGWRLSRGPWAPGGADGVYGKDNKVFTSGSAYTLTDANWVPRVNGDTEAWVRFSAIRVNRITVKANAGDTIIYSGPNWVGNGEPTLTKVAGPKGWASVVGGGFFYGRTYTVYNQTQGVSVDVCIPYSWQPKVDFTTAPPTVKKATCPTAPAAASSLVPLPTTP